MARGRAAAFRNLLIAATVAGCATRMTGCAAAPPAPPPDVPEALRAPAGQMLSRELKATGVQIYVCKASKDEPGRFEWSLLAPEAELRDRTGHPVGRHYAGPTWEAADGSKVVGEVRARDSGPDPGAIAWLLLRATSTAGRGVFSQTESIQRIHTSGGKAPAGGCTETQLGHEARVPYQADYLFYVLRP